MPWREKIVTTKIRLTKIKIINNKKVAVTIYSIFLGPFFFVIYLAYHLEQIYPHFRIMVIIFVNFDIDIRRRKE